MSMEDQLRERFVCPKCSHREAAAKRIATTGAGLTRFLDVQHNQFVAVSCGHCGYTELYNPEVFEGRSDIANVFDALFGT